MTDKADLLNVEMSVFSVSELLYLHTSIGESLRPRL